jgi:hypothetical protein
MIRIGLILLAIWLLLSGLRSLVNIGYLGNNTLLSALQIAAGILIIFGQVV